MSIAYDKNLNSLLDLIINCISARSACQVLSIKGECTFLFSHFLIVVLLNSSANSLFKIFSFLVPQPEVFLSKKPIDH